LTKVINQKTRIFLCEIIQISPVLLPLNSAWAQAGIEERASARTQ